jgi:glycerol-3-phosphate dehydrogenase (NAD(P)+)
VLGAGAWGTALAKVLHENGNAVTLWDINAETLGNSGGRSERYLPGVKLPTDWKAEPDFQKASAAPSAVVMAIPSQFFRQVAAKLKGIREFW